MDGEWNILYKKEVIMSAYSTQLKSLIEQYKKDNPDTLTDPHELASWAYHNGLIKPYSKTIIDVIASDISQVFREEYRTDKLGRRYRAKHAVKSKKNNRNMSLWADIDDENVPCEHFVKSFAQRRQQIVGDCLQLKTDVDVYNDKHAENKNDQIQLVLDFTNDVEELQIPYKKSA